MKYIKAYEEEKKLKIGDYVIIKCGSGIYFDNSNETKNFINNNIGRYIKYSRGYDLKYGVKYDNVPSFLEKNLDLDLFWFERHEIVDYSDSKEELELKLSTKKYNL